MQVTHIQTDGTLMATELRCTADRPIRFYLDIMDAFEEACIQWHWHPELEFNVILHGQVEYYVEQEHYTLSAGQGIMKNANVLHMVEPAAGSEDAQMFSVIMDPVAIAPPGSAIYQKYIAPLRANRALHCLPLSPEDPWQAEVLRCLQDAYAADQAQEGAYELRVQQLMCRMWQLLAENAGDLTAPPPTAAWEASQERIRRMLLFIEEHYAERVTLDMIAASAHISRSACLNCFRLLLGITPMAYLLDHRLEQAYRLLLTTNLPIAEIAEQCGFPDRSHFGKQFRTKTGLSPAQYRAQRRGAPMKEGEETP